MLEVLNIGAVGGITGAIAAETPSTADPAARASNVGRVMGNIVGGVVGLCIADVTGIVPSLVGDFFIGSAVRSAVRSAADHEHQGEDAAPIVHNNNDNNAAARFVGSAMGGFVGGVASGVDEYESTHHQLSEHFSPNVPREKAAEAFSNYRGYLEKQGEVFGSVLEASFNLREMLNAFLDRFDHSKSLAEIFPIPLGVESECAISPLTIGEIKNILQEYLKDKERDFKNQLLLLMNSQS